MVSLKSETLPARKAARAPSQCPSRVHCSWKEPPLASLKIRKQCAGAFDDAEWDEHFDLDTAHGDRCLGRVSSDTESEHADVQVHHQPGGESEFEEKLQG